MLARWQDAVPLHCFSKSCFLQIKVLSGIMPTWMYRNLILSNVHTQDIDAKSNTAHIARHTWDVCHTQHVACFAAGVDLQKDVLDLMGFKPLMPNVQLMDKRCFSK